VKIAILCEPSERDKFMQLLFAETTTLGVRVSEIERHCLPREFAKVSTEYGEIDVKFARLDDKTVKFAPEYEQLRTAAVENNVPLREVEAAARKAFEEQQK
jgi:pyridinium-3,5-bisthiocarboxylic acid mononucleotide nickel chelatase